MATNVRLDENINDINVDQTRGMIGSLLYLTASKPDIALLVFVLDFNQIPNNHIIQQ